MGDQPKDSTVLFHAVLIGFATFVSLILFAVMLNMLKKPREGPAYPLDTDAAVVYKGAAIRLEKQEEDGASGAVVMLVDDREVMRFAPGGNIYVHGDLTENNMTVVREFRDWLQTATYHVNDSGTP